VLDWLNDGAVAARIQYAVSMLLFSLQFTLSVRFAPSRLRLFLEVYRKGAKKANIREASSGQINIPKNISLNNRMFSLRTFAPFR
jgi:hypothetical protein